MTCRFCGAGLPEGAIFCGACGRSVSGQRTLGPGRVPTTPEPTGADAPSCPQCRSAVAPDDVFCRECGFVLRRPRLGPPAEPTAGSETAVVPVEPPRGNAEEDAPDASDVWDAPGVPDVPDAPVVASVLPVTPRGPLTVAAGERFILQFSTGESVAVTGSGFIGRNPVAQPGESVDQFIVVGDAGKSVSKTHIEFGQEDGWFWVSDRYSTNGSVVRIPDHPPVTCQPGRRYRVPRGARVDMGDQFFVVS